MQVSVWVYASVLVFVFSRVTDRLRSLMIRFNEWESRAIKVSVYYDILQLSCLQQFSLTVLIDLPVFETHSVRFTYRGVPKFWIHGSVCCACARRTGVAARVERRRRER